MTSPGAEMELRALSLSLHVTQAWVTSSVKWGWLETPVRLYWGYGDQKFLSSVPGVSAPCSVPEYFQLLSQKGTSSTKWHL